MGKKDTGLWAAWIASNGRPYYNKPQKLYHHDELDDTLWHKGGNDFVGINDRGLTATD